MKTKVKDFSFKAREAFRANQNPIAKGVAITTATCLATASILGAVKLTATSIHALGVVNGVAKFAMITTKAGLLSKLAVGVLGIGLAGITGVCIYALLSKK